MFVRYRWRNIQPSFLQISKRYASTNKVRNDPRGPFTKLKFDPKENGNFSNFGVLPFLQQRLNQLEKLNDDHDNDRFRKLGVLPKDHSRDLSPTPDQRIILSVLGSEHSLLFRGDSYSGKSLSIAIHALNFTLSRVPKFGQISSGYSVDSVILVPTDDLVKKYLKYFRFLTKGLPTDCCPDQLVPEKEEYKVSRRPLEINFVYTDMNSDTLTTGEASKTPPQILVTTPSIFHRLLNQKSQLGLGPECYKETQLLAVDGSNYILETTDIQLPENVSLTLEGPKRKYRNILKSIVSTVQKLQMDHYMDSLRRRLKSVEIKAKDQDSDPIPRGFDYTKWTLASNVSALDVEKSIKKQYPKNDRPNLNLLRKMVKTKRKYLYKPLQFCFVMEPIYQKPYRKLIQLDGSKVSRGPAQVRQLQDQLDVKKAKDHNMRVTDPQRSFVERIVRFSDSERTIRKSGRNLVVVGSQDYFEPTNSIQCFLHKKGDKKLKEIDTTANWPANEFHEAWLEASLSENEQKRSLQQLLQKSLQNLASDQILHIIRNSMKNVQDGAVFVIPPFIDLEDIKAKLVDSNNSACTSLMEPSELTVLTHPDALLVNKVRTKHLYILGLECLYPQAALSSWSKFSVNSVPGIEIPFTDMLRFYLKRCEDFTKVSIVLLDPEHLEMLSRILLMNKLQISSKAGLKLTYRKS
ncbi:hypothetical protein QA089_002565 [Meyerozyma guilliermondii]